jgi:hypothetical protein
MKMRMLWWVLWWVQLIAWFAFIDLKAWCVLIALKTYFAGLLVYTIWCRERERERETEREFLFNILSILSWSGKREYVDGNI